MKRSTASVFVLLTTLVGALALTALRYYQLSNCMDENGLLIPGSRVIWGFVALGVLLIAALVLLIVRLDKTPGTDVCLHGGMFFNLLSAGAAAAIMAACAYCSVKTPLGDTVHLIIYTVGVAMGALLVISDALRIWGKRSNLALLLLPALFLAARLIFDFKQWSTDPIVIDFCFKLLASICAMLACFNLSGFPIRLGKKRTTVFFCMLAFAFSAMTAADYILHRNCPTRELALYASIGLWCFINGLMLLFPCGEAKQALIEDTASEQ